MNTSTVTRRDGHANDQHKAKMHNGLSPVEAAYARLDKALGAMEKEFTDMVERQKETDLLDAVDAASDASAELRKSLDVSESRASTLEDKLNAAETIITDLRQRNEILSKKVTSAIIQIEEVLEKAA